MWLHEEYKTFHGYAIEQLPMECRSRFWNISKNYVSYFRFRSLLRDPQYGLRVKLSRAVQNPEILWFVIRSYIKGFNLDAEGDDRWMTPEQFATEEELSRRDRQVSQQVYDEIWDQVWPWYKRLTIPCRENNYAPPYWDNLDLAWEVLNNRWSEAPKYAVLICDEVQDLTRVELAAIFQSSEYLKYHRDPNQASRVPIILAGDSYQTINPACFRWSRVKADCAKALMQQVPNASPPRIEPFQLVYNYRNRPSIARLCNALQRLRELIVGEAGELQRVWQPQDLPLNQAVRQLRIAEDGVILRDLFLKGVLFLGPEPLPAFGDETSAAFWKALGLPDGPPHVTSLQTSTTKSESRYHKVTNDDLVQTINYDCPADVKGLEKPFYALLGFGTAFAQLNLRGFWEWNNHTRDTVPEADLLAAEYFLNRLYVAASRAREQLWIVETEAGWNAFWKPLKEWVDRIKTTSSPNYNSHDHQLISFEWSSASANELVAVFQKEWPTLAKDYEEQAEANHNPEFAERAAYYYRLMNDSLGEARSRALHRYLEGKLKEAVEIQIKIDQEKACQWAWEAAAWETLTRIEFKSTWQYQLAELMQVTPTNRGNFWVNKLAQIIDAKHCIISEDIAHIRKSWTTWSIVITELLECAAQAQLDEQAISEARRIGRLWQNSPHHDSKRYYKALGHIEYKLKCFPEAVNLWESATHTQNLDYYLAKAYVSPYPNNLQYLDSAQQWQEILLQEETHRGQSLSTQDRRRVLRACRELHRWRQAVRIAASLDNQDFVELWAYTVADPTVTIAELRDYIRDTHEAWRKLNRESDNNDRARSWSLLIIDCLLHFHDRRTENQYISIVSQSVDRIYEPLFYGLKWECDVKRITGLFRRGRDSRQERSLGDVYEALLKKIGPAGLTCAQQAWDQGRHEEAATIVHLLCGLVWDSVERTEDTELGGWFDQLVPYSYVARLSASTSANDYSPTSLITNDLLDDINPSFLELAHSALRAIADAPAELFRKLQGSRWRDLHDLINGIAYLFYNKVKDYFKSAPELTLLQQTDLFLLIGKVCEQANFRKLAVRYYEILSQATERIAFPDDFRLTVLARVEQARQTQREYREQREATQDEVFVRPGEKGKTPSLLVRSLSHRPEVILELLPDTDSYQARFIVETDRRVHLKIIPPIRISGPRDSSSVEWQLQVPSGERYRLLWLKSSGRLRVEAPDRVFIIEVNLQQT